jgi:hypothetical protein
VPRQAEPASVPEAPERGCTVGWVEPCLAYRPFDGTDAAVADVGEVEIEAVWTSWSGCGAQASERYEALFRENDIDETVLPNLTAEDLKELASRRWGTAASCSMLLLLCAPMRAARRLPLTWRPRPPPQARERQGAFR